MWASSWTCSPLLSKTGLDLNPIFWLTILDATSGSQARPRLGFWTCTFVAFLTLPLGLLKVPLSLNDPGSHNAEDDFVAPLSAFAGT